MSAQPVVLIGGGGHAKVVADILANAEITIAGCVCPRGASQLPNIEWLGDDDDLPRLRQQRFECVHVAVGSNARRRALAQCIKELGFRLTSAVSSRAVVSSLAHLAPGVAVMPGAVINVDAYVGECAIVNTSASIDHDCRIGDYAHVGPGCHLAGNVIVSEGAFLGTGVSVIPEMEIGSWSVVGAGAVVIAAIPDNATAAGVPARIIRQR